APAPARSPVHLDRRFRGVGRPLGTARPFVPTGIAGAPLAPRRRRAAHGAGLAHPLRRASPRARPRGRGGDRPPARPAAYGAKPPEERAARRPPPRHCPARRGPGGLRAPAGVACVPRAQRPAPRPPRLAQAALRSAYSRDLRGGGLLGERRGAPADVVLR